MENQIQENNNISTNEPKAMILESLANVCEYHLIIINIKLKMKAVIFAHQKLKNENQNLKILFEHLNELLTLIEELFCSFRRIESSQVEKHESIEQARIKLNNFLGQFTGKPEELIYQWREGYKLNSNENLSVVEFIREFMNENIIVPNTDNIEKELEEIKEELNEMKSSYDNSNQSKEPINNIKEKFNKLDIKQEIENFFNEKFFYISEEIESSILHLCPTTDFLISSFETVKNIKGQISISRIQQKTMKLSLLNHNDQAITLVNKLDNTKTKWQEYCFDDWYKFMKLLKSKGNNLALLWNEEKSNILEDKLLTCFLICAFEKYKEGDFVEIFQKNEKTIKKHLLIEFKEALDKMLCLFLKKHFFNLQNIKENDLKIISLILEKYINLFNRLPSGKFNEIRKLYDTFQNEIDNAKNSIKEDDPSNNHYENVVKKLKKNNYLQKIILYKELNRYIKEKDVSSFEKLINYAIKNKILSKDFSSRLILESAKSNQIAICYSVFKSAKKIGSKIEEDEYIKQAINYVDENGDLKFKQIFFENIHFKTDIPVENLLIYQLYGNPNKILNNRKKLQELANKGKLVTAIADMNKLTSQLDQNIKINYKYKKIIKKFVFEEFKNDFKQAMIKVLDPDGQNSSLQHANLNGLLNSIRKNELADKVKFSKSDWEKYMNCNKMFSKIKLNRILFFSKQKNMCDFLQPEELIKDLPLSLEKKYKKYFDQMDLKLKDSPSESQSSVRINSASSLDLVNNLEHNYNNSDLRYDSVESGCSIILSSDNDSGNKPLTPCSSEVTPSQEESRSADIIEKPIIADVKVIPRQNKERQSFATFRSSLSADTSSSKRSDRSSSIPSISSISSISSIPESTFGRGLSSRDAQLFNEQPQLFFQLIL